MPQIELIFDADCPNVTLAREQLSQALAIVGLPQHWKEWSSDHPERPERARGYGSPTILVEGQDVSGAGQLDGTAGCRIYATTEGLRGVPTIKAIVSALDQAC
jgi:mercuric ion transport protein